MAAEMCDLPGQGDGETGIHHFVADREAGGMNEERRAETMGVAVRGKLSKKLPVILSRKSIVIPRVLHILRS